MAETQNVNPTPKQRLLENKARINAHNSLLNNPQLEDSLQTALSECQRVYSMPSSSPNFNDAAANLFRMQGVQQLVDTFLKLSIPYARPEPSKIVGLDHKV